MSRKGILRPSVSKLIVLTSLGIISAAGLGIFELLNQESQESHNLPELPPSPEQIKKADEPEISKTTSETTASVEVSVMTSDAIPTQTAQKAEDKYPIDNDYLSKVGSHSMAYKYKDYLVLSPANDPIGKEKAQKLKKLAEQSEHKTVGTYGYGHGNTSQITAASTHQLCSWASSYSETTTFLSIGAYKSYFDFLWDICGRENTNKPSGWWYR